MPATQIAPKQIALTFADVPSAVDEEFLTKVAEILERLKAQSEMRGHPLLASLLAITKDEAYDHFRRTVAGSKWENMRGYHTLRHSFISALASEGVDQRIIDEIVGHQSEQQRKRYRHLYPKVMKEAIGRMFG